MQRLLYGYSHVGRALNLASLHIDHEPLRLAGVAGSRCTGADLDSDFVLPLRILNEHLAPILPIERKRAVLAQQRHPQARQFRSSHSLRLLCMMPSTQEGADRAARIGALLATAQKGCDAVHVYVTGKQLPPSDVGGGSPQQGGLGATSAPPSEVGRVFSCSKLDAASAQSCYYARRLLTREPNRLRLVALVYEHVVPSMPSLTSGKRCTTCSCTRTVTSCAASTGLRK